jgi:hypothetical protein
MPTDNCQYDYIVQIKSITMKCLSHISILSLVSYYIIKSCIDLNTYDKNQKHWVDVAFELSFDWNTPHFQIKSWIHIYESWEKLIFKISNNCDIFELQEMLWNMNEWLNGQTDF